MRPWAIVLTGLILVSMVCGRVMADRATPWVEGTKVGDVATEHAWVVALNPEMTAYGVLVTTDTMTHVLIQAEAGKGVVDPAVLGRWAKVKAKVIQREGGTVKVEILEVTVIKGEGK